MPNASMAMFKQQLELAFEPRDFQSMWFALNGKYKALDFQDDISDSVRIQEYKWIVQQFRKYISSHKEDILFDCQDGNEMLECIGNLLGNAAEYGDERKVIAYNFIRDDWLMELQNYVIGYMYDNQPVEEEDE